MFHSIRLSPRDTLNVVWDSEFLLPVRIETLVDGHREKQIALTAANAAKLRDALIDLLKDK